MPAIPAWPAHNMVRIFVDQPLSCPMELALDGKNAHYVVTVMRHKPGQYVRLFDNRTGEYIAEITATTKKTAQLSITEKIKEREILPDFWLCAAPIKKPRMDFMVEKCCELGMARFVPVLTRRSVVDKVKPDKIMAHMVEAAEQCERNALPVLGEISPLKNLLNGWPEDRHLFFADERLHERHDDNTGDNGSFRKALRENAGAAALLIGPEGGFDDEEQALIRQCPQAIPISFGPRILRAETAAIAGMAIWMAGRGDWDG